VQTLLALVCRLARLAAEVEVEKQPMKLMLQLVAVTNRAPKQSCGKRLRTLC